MAGPSLADDAAEKAAVTLENLKKASDFKESGNAFYKDKELGKAMRCYHNGHLITRAMLPMSGSEGQAGMFAGMEKTPSKMIPEIKALHHALLNNISGNAASDTAWKLEYCCSIWLGNSRSPWDDNGSDRFSVSWVL
eukprot:m.177272 g.177272  ORF g.177272 m.177272 type:complete len:137 (-) comp18366_c0_seq12:1084-1494(-)